MTVQRSLGRLLAGLAAGVLLAGCATGSTPSPQPTSVPATPAVKPGAAAPAASSTATAPAATPAAVTYGPVAVVSGSSTCPDATTGTETTDAQGVVLRRGGTISCTATVNDPRVSGTSTRDANWDAWGTPEAGARVQWGTARLTNEKGSWEGTYTGVWDSVHGDTIAVWYTGSGGYAGLSYFELITGQAPYTIRGQIQPGDPPSMEGLPPLAGTTFPPTESVAPVLLPTPVAYGPVTTVEGSLRHGAGGNRLKLVGIDPANGAEHWQASDSHWVMETNDARVSGLNVTDLNMDGWESPAHGAAIQWGSSRTENDEGSWTGTCTGVYSTVHGDTYVCWSTGSGGYAGLTFFWLGTGAPPNTIQGLIYPGTPPQS